MAPRLSTRISIRWQDEAASEPTTTIVMTVGGYFMDLRVNKSDDSVDWAFAGTRETVTQDPLHCRWHHIIDSRNVFDPDEGHFQKLPNGDDLETGSMPCPERDNAVTPYEEVWRSIQPAAGLEHIGWVLQREDGDDKKATTFLGRVGGVFFAMKQEHNGGAFTAQREALEPAAEEAEHAPRWVCKYRSGDASLPSLAELKLLEFPGEATWKVGDQVDVLGQLYTVQATEQLTKPWSS